MLNFCFCTEAVDQLFAADPGRPAGIPHKEGMHDPCHCRALIRWPTLISAPRPVGDLRDIYNDVTEAIMNEDVFNGSIRKFLKGLGVSAQREIEKAVRHALAEGRLKGNEKFPAKATVTLGGIAFSHEIKGEIELE